jgi:hypothetical protein
MRGTLGIVLCLFLSLLGCRNAPQAKPDPSAPVWFLTGYDSAKGFTFSENLLVDYVATCESFRPARVTFSKDPDTGMTTDVQKHPDCTGLLPLIGGFQQLHVTTNNNDLMLTTDGGVYDFKIVSVHNETVTPSSSSSADHETSEDN